MTFENTHLEFEEKRYSSRILVKEARRMIVVKVADIEWIEASSNYLELHVGSTVLFHRGTMKEMVKRLPPDQFVRIHRSLIVNLERVKEVRTIAKGRYAVILRDGQELVSNLSLQEIEGLIVTA